jgi:hypothetical protein
VHMWLVHQAGLCQQLNSWSLFQGSEQLVWHVVVGQVPLEAWMPQAGSLHALCTQGAVAWGGMGALSLRMSALLLAARAQGRLGGMPVDNRPPTAGGMAWHVMQVH